MLIWVFNIIGSNKNEYQFRQEAETYKLSKNSNS